MKQTIEIEVPDGKKAVWKNNKVVFEDIKPQLPKTWEEFCCNNDRKPGESFIVNSSEIQCITEKHERKSYQDRNLLPSKEAAEQHLALMQLHQLRDCYRQDWIPDYTDSSKKWCILKYDNKPTIDVHYHRNEFLSFQTREIAEQFLNNFRGLIEQAGDLI